MFPMIFQSLTRLKNQGVMFLVVPPKDVFVNVQEIHENNASLFLLILLLTYGWIG
jgi:hypothetical protein